MSEKLKSVLEKVKQLRELYDACDILQKSTLRDIHGVCAGLQCENCIIGERIHALREELKKLLKEEISNA